MRLRSGVFAASCLLVEALGVALFLRGFFPVPVRSLPRREARGDPPAEPASPGTGNPSGRPVPGAWAAPPPRGPSTGGSCSSGKPRCPAPPAAPGSGCRHEPPARPGPAPAASRFSARTRRDEGRRGGALARLGAWPLTAVSAAAGSCWASRAARLQRRERVVRALCRGVPRCCRTAFGSAGFFPDPFPKQMTT